MTDRACLNKSKIMEYYSARNGKRISSELDLYNRFYAVIRGFVNRDYFKEKLEVSRNSQNYELANDKSIGQIGFSVFPIDSWKDEITKNDIFDAIEFFYRFISKPGEYGAITNQTGFNYDDYLEYNDIDGRKEFTIDVNVILGLYEDGYELDENGRILFLGGEDVNFLETDFPEYNEENIDSVIHLAIKQWKNKEQSLEEKKRAIIKLADVFEYLKSEGALKSVLNKKDSSDIFQIANNFSLRHHNPNQNTSYDKAIWYDWIFQFYLATCITTLKLIKKKSLNTGV